MDDAATQKAVDDAMPETPNPDDISEALSQAQQLVGLIRDVRGAGDTSNLHSAFTTPWIAAGNSLRERTKDAFEAIALVLGRIEAVTDGVVTCGIASETTAFRVVLRLALHIITLLGYVEAIRRQTISESRLKMADRDAVVEAMASVGRIDLWEWNTLLASLQREAIQAAKDKDDSEPDVSSQVTVEKTTVPSDAEIREESGRAEIQEHDNKQRIAAEFLTLAVDDTSLALINVFQNDKLKAEKKMQEAANLDNRLIAQGASWWADRCNVTDAAIRKTLTWKRWQTKHKNG